MLRARLIRWASGAWIAVFLLFLAPLIHATCISSFILFWLLERLPFANLAASLSRPFVCPLDTLSRLQLKTLGGARHIASHLLAGTVSRIRGTSAGTSSDTFPVLALGHLRPVYRCQEEHSQQHGGNEAAFCLEEGDEKARTQRTYSYHDGQVCQLARNTHQRSVETLPIGNQLWNCTGSAASTGHGHPYRLKLTQRS